MKEFLLSSELIYHVAPRDDMINYIYEGMKAMKRIGFEGILNFELSTGRIPASAREAFGKYVCQAAKELITYM